MRFLKVVRFSSVGVFFAGIIGVIQGCSVEREGALFAALLFLLNFCTGPVEEEAPTTRGVVPITIDDFSVAETTTPRIVTCGVVSDGPKTAIPNSFKEINARQIRMPGSTVVVGNSTITYTVPGDGTITITAGAVGSGCKWPNNFAIVTWSNALGNLSDLSTLQRIEIPVLASTGVTFCTLLTSPGNAGLTPAKTPTPPTLTFDNPGWNAATQELRLGGCDFAPGAILRLGAIVPIQ